MIHLCAGICTIIVSSHFEDIGTWLQMSERHDITTSIGLAPLLRTVHSVLVNHVFGIGIIQRRELHREGIVDEIEREMLLSRQSLSANIYAGKVYLTNIITHLSEILRIKRCYTIAETKPRPTISSTHGYTAYILTTSQSVTIKIAHKLLIHMLILPKSHSGAYPQVASIIFDNSANYLIT